MTTLEILVSIDNSIGLATLAKRNILPISVIVQKEIYLEYDKFIRLNYTSMDAISMTAERFNVSERTVYRAKKSMEK